MKTLGQRIRERRKTRKLTQKEVANFIGVSSVAVTQWEKDETSPRGENLFKLAKALKCKAFWLLNGGDSTDSLESNDFILTAGLVSRIPVISLVRAGMWQEICCNFQEADAEEWINVADKVGIRAFGLKVQGDSMTNPLGSPSMPEGSIVIIDPDIEARSGRIVVAKLVDSNEATLKKLVIDGSQKYLVPLNPRYNPLPINGNCTIVGVAVSVTHNLL